MWVACVVQGPIMVSHVRPAVAFHISIWSSSHQLTFGTVSLGKLLHAIARIRVTHKVLETAALGRFGRAIVGEILTFSARSRRLLLKAFPSFVPIVGIPILFAITTRSTLVCVEIKQLSCGKEDKYDTRISGSLIENIELANWGNSLNGAIFFNSRSISFLTLIHAVE